MIDHRPTVRIAALLAAAVLASACSGAATTPDPTAAQPADAAVVGERRAVEAPARADDAALERRVSSLELQVLEKTQQAQELQTRLDDARREVVRAMAKLQSVASRAEAASGIAEAELALESLPPTAAQAVAEVRQLMEQSSAEFDRGNFGGALYLANQAKGAATTARGQIATAEQTPLRPYERSLALPLQLQTTRGANVRAGPGTTFAVLFTLPAEAPIVAYSAADEWLRIADDSGRGGWISQSLIRGRP